MADFDNLLDSMEDAGAFSPAQRNLCAGLLAKFEPTPDVGTTMFADAVPPEVGAIHEAIEKDHRAYYLSHKDLDTLPSDTHFVVDMDTYAAGQIIWQPSPEIAEIEKREFADLLATPVSDDGIDIIGLMKRLYKLTEHYETDYIQHLFGTGTGEIKTSRPAVNPMVICAPTGRPAQALAALAREQVEDRLRRAPAVVSVDFAEIESRTIAHILCGTRGDVVSMDMATHGFPRWSYDEFFHFANQPRYDLPPAEDDGADKRRKQAKLTYKDRAADSRDAKAAMRERALAKLAKRKKR